MHNDEFEDAYGGFLDSNKCDRMTDDLFAALRTAFAAGWVAAGGEEPAPLRDNLIFLTLEKAEDAPAHE